MKSMLAISAMLWSTHAVADAGTGTAPLLVRSHTLAELEVGILMLPSAPISVANQGGSTPFGTIGKGDATVQTGLHVLYRGWPDWAFGAGIMFAPRPTSDTNYQQLGGLSGLHRSHTRSYFALGGEIRYFPYRSKWVEAWVGVVAGGVVVADRFSNESATPVPTILGTPEATVRTEGFTASAQVGGDYLLTDHWILGLALRGGYWILPDAKPFRDEKACTAIGDCPTISGGATAFEVGLTVGYRLYL